MRWTEAQLAEHLARRTASAPGGFPPSRKRHKRAAGRHPIDMDEATLHRAVVEHLRTRGRPGVAWWHTPNGELRDPITAAKLKAMGTRPGIPDVFLLIEARLHGLELKRERGGRVSDAQRAMQEELRNAGAVIETARGIDEALGVLETWGALKADNKG